eukprot:IDg10325t1
MSRAKIGEKWHAINIEAHKKWIVRAVGKYKRRQWFESTDTQRTSAEAENEDATGGQVSDKEADAGGWIWHSVRSGEARHRASAEALKPTQTQMIKQYWAKWRGMSLSVLIYG